MGFQEFIGHVSTEWLDNLSKFKAQLAEHEWGGESAERLVIASDVANALAAWMQADEWAEESDSIAAAADGDLIIGGKAFLAHDGLWTALVRETDEEETFLFLAGHELTEAAMERRQLSYENFSPPVPNTVAQIAHLVWSEYAVERTRTQIALSLGIPAAKEEQRHDLLRTIVIVAKEAMAVGAIGNQAWADLMLMWARVLGRTVGGRTEEKADLDAFYPHGVMSHVSPLWEQLAAALDAVYAEPAASPVEQDARLLIPIAAVFQTRPSPPPE